MRIVGPTPNFESTRDVQLGNVAVIRKRLILRVRACCLVYGMH
jgi:hypothetical protein